MNTRISGGSSSYFKHWVKFCFKVPHPDKGVLKIQSQIPRYVSHQLRPIVTDDVLQMYMSLGTEWTYKFWKTDGPEADYTRAINACVIWALYTNPFSPLHSKEIEYYIYFNIWVFLVDDALEHAVRQKLGQRQMQDYCNQTLAILDGKFDALDNPETCLRLDGHEYMINSFLALLDIHRKCKIYIPQYKRNAKELGIYIKRFLDIFTWVNTNGGPSCIDSKNLFSFFRALDSANDMCVGFICMLRECRLGKEVREHFLFKLIEEQPGLGGYINDVLGMRKTCFEPDINNLAMYYMDKEGMSVQESVDCVCRLIGEKWALWQYTKPLILERFKDDKNVADWFDIIEANLDGNYPMYMHSTRYYAQAGTVYLDSDAE